MIPQLIKLLVWCKAVQLIKYEHIHTKKVAWYTLEVACRGGFDVNDKKDVYDVNDRHTSS